MAYEVRVASGLAVSRRRTLAHFGPARGGVRVLDDTRAGYIRVQWYELGERRVKSWARTLEGKAEAIAWAQGFTETRFGRPITLEHLTLRALWDRYTAAEFPQLRPRTRELYGEHWRRWELFLGRAFVGEDARQETIDRFRARLTVLGLAVGHQQRIVRTVKTVYAWADSRELLARNRLAGYRFKIAKELRPEPPPAYTREEVERIIAELNPQHAGEWRPWCILVLAAYQGARVRAILHLTVQDVDLVRGTISWRAKYDKTGQERIQPLTIAGYCAVLTAFHHRETRLPWLFPSPWGRKKAGREEPGVYGTQALWLALQQAEASAGVDHRPFRALHGFRRSVAKDVAATTGDPMRGMDWIGDSDTKMIPLYVQGQSAELSHSAALLDRAWAMPELAAWHGPTPRSSIYVIEDVGTGDLKLGLARYVPGRVAELQRHHARPLRLVLVIPGGRTREQALLRQFAAHRLQGEWLRPAAEITAWIQQQQKELQAQESVIVPSSGPAPEAGLEPATRRLTAGCSTN